MSTNLNELYSQILRAESLANLFFRPIRDYATKRERAREREREREIRYKKIRVVNHTSIKTC